MQRATRAVKLVHMTVGVFLRIDLRSFRLVMTDVNTTVNSLILAGMKGCQV